MDPDAGQAPKTSQIMEVDLTAAPKVEPEEEAAEDSSTALETAKKAPEEAKTSESAPEEPKTAPSEPAPQLMEVEPSGSKPSALDESKDSCLEASTSEEKKQFFNDFLDELKAFETLPGPSHKPFHLPEPSIPTSLPDPGLDKSFDLGPVADKSFELPVSGVADKSFDLSGAGMDVRPSMASPDFPDLNDAEMATLLHEDPAGLDFLSSADEKPPPPRPQSWPSPVAPALPTYQSLTESKLALSCTGLEGLEPSLITDAQLIRPSQYLPEGARGTAFGSVGGPEVGPGGQPEAKTIEMLGQRLRLVEAAELAADEAWVRTSDIFQRFFSKRHWDEFKTVLEKNEVHLKVVPDSARLNFTVEVMKVSEVERLLMSGVARKEGFVRCRTLDEAGGGPGTSGVIQATGERPPMELASGIRTRHGDHSDIAYVKLEGQTLPAAMALEEEWVRLADVQASIFRSDPHVNRADLKRMRSLASRLGLGLEKIPTSVKWRLVAQAGSARSNSLHVVPARNLAQLVNAVRNPRAALDALKASSRSSAEAAEAESEDEEEAEEERSRQPSGDSDATESEADLLARLPKVPAPAEDPEDLAYDHEAELEGVPESLKCLTQPIVVSIERSEPLKVAVCSPRMTSPSVFGDYFHHLFLYPNAPCVRCVTCGEYFGIRTFLGHHHAPWAEHTAPKLHLYFEGFKHRPPHFHVWDALHQRLRSVA